MQCTIYSQKGIKQPSTCAEEIFQPVLASEEEDKG